MARQRKSIQLAKLVERTNRILAAQENEHITSDFKAGIASMLEWSLTQANAYAGYRYLDPECSALDEPGYWRREYFMPRD